MNVEKVDWQPYGGIVFDMISNDKICKYIDGDIKAHAKLIAASPSLLAAARKDHDILLQIMRDFNPSPALQTLLAGRMNELKELIARVS